LIRLLTGDCREVLRTLDANSIDSCVTDPPYHLTAGKKGGTGAASVDLESPYGRARIGTGNGPGGFMGMQWDGGDVAFQPETWAEVLRVLKPGAYLLAFGGTRTYHGGTVLDPFAGSGSTLKGAELEGFKAIGIELNPEYVEIARRRIGGDAPLFAEVEVAA
jgi:DNA modification methylase